MPEELKVPGRHGGHATINTDVMAFLGLKSVQSVKSEAVKPKSPE